MFYKVIAVRCGTMLSRCERDDANKVTNNIFLRKKKENQNVSIKAFLPQKKIIVKCFAFFTLYLQRMYTKNQEEHFLGIKLSKHC